MQKIYQQSMTAPPAYTPDKLIANRFGRSASSDDQSYIQCLVSRQLCLS